MPYENVELSKALATRLQEVFELTSPPPTLGDWARQALGSGREVAESDLISAEPTRHRVHLGQETVHAYCIIDAMMLPLMRGASSEIETADPHSGERLGLRITARGNLHDDPSLAGAVVSFGLAREGAAALKCVCCPYLNLFATSGSYEKWTRAHPEVASVRLSLPAAFALARAWLGAGR